MTREDLRKPDDHFRIEFGASFSDLEEGEVMLVATDRRDAKRFAGYLLPLWLARRDDKCIISVSPKRQSLAESVFERATPEEIFSKKGLDKVAVLAEAIGGSIHNHGPYLCNMPNFFKPHKAYKVTELRESDKDIFTRHKGWFGDFNSYWNESKHQTRVFTIFENNIPVSTAYTMANSMYAWEYAVWTHEEYRRKGYGKTVLTAAVEVTFKCGKLPIYSTSWENIPSRRLAESLGFEFYCENYALKIAAEKSHARTDRPLIDW